jgi:hypothetical protein
VVQQNTPPGAAFPNLNAVREPGLLSQNILLS